MLQAGQFWWCLMTLSLRWDTQCWPWRVYRISGFSRAPFSTFFDLSNSSLVCTSFHCNSRSLFHQAQKRPWCTFWLASAFAVNAVCSSLLHPSSNRILRLRTCVEGASCSIRHMQTGSRQDSELSHTVVVHASLQRVGRHWFPPLYFFLQFHTASFHKPTHLCQTVRIILASSYPILLSRIRERRCLGCTSSTSVRNHECCKSYATGLTLASPSYGLGICWKWTSLSGSSPATSSASSLAYSSKDSWGRATHWRPRPRLRLHLLLHQEGPYAQVWMPSCALRDRQIWIQGYGVVWNLVWILVHKA